MVMQKTLVMVKPDGVLMRNVDSIRKVYQAHGLRVVEEYEVQFPIQLAREFYRDHDGRFYFAGLILSISSGPAHVFVLEGEDAIGAVRKLNGATIPAEAAPGTIRHDFRSAGGPFNTVHSSDSPISFVHELSVIRHLLGE